MKGMKMELMKEKGDPKKPAPTREELSGAVKREQEARLQRCKARIEAALKEENCVLTANAGMEEIQPGKFVTVTAPGIRAL
jgi:hypothetical protein